VAVASELNPTDSLPAELRLIDEAKDALTAGDTARVIERVDRYDLAFPSPHLAAEALALRIEAYALRHDRARVQSLSDAFLASYPQHPVAARVRLLRDAR
jgi:outer membrane protein assembly factor BamD (BamD/ComL family)